MTSERSLRRWSLAALLTNMGIVVTGGLVRVTGSGLGCPQWPACQEGSVVPVPGAEPGWHQAIEFGNRLLTFVVLVAVVGALLAARRDTEPGSRARGLAAWLVAGVLAQAVLGGITVRLDLHPGTVMAHFLLSMVLIAIATLLLREVHGTPPPSSDLDTEAARGLRVMLRGLPVLGALVLVLGTLVTASGPHAGDPGTPRLGLEIVAIARVHSVSVWSTVLLTLLALRRARAVGYAPVSRGLAALLAVEVAQGAVGYWQFLTGVPAGLVLLHMALATVFWVALVDVAALSGALTGSATRAPQPTGA